MDNGTNATTPEIPANRPADAAANPPAPEPIEANLWWVVPGKLAGVRRPAAEELPALQRAGIGAIASLMDDRGNLDLYDRGGWPYLWLPATGGTPPTRAQLSEFCQFLAEQQARDRAVAVHCTSGRRRTGTLLAAYLVQTGLDWEAALARIRAANPAVELREAQVAFLRSLGAEPDANG